MTWLHDLIGAQPAHHVALVDHDGTRFDYGTFRDMVETLTERLVDAGLRPGDRLMLVSENCATYAVAVMAASRVGAWIMPVNARQTAEELAALRAHAGPRLIRFRPEASTASQDHAARFGEMPNSARFPSTRERGEIVAHAEVRIITATITARCAISFPFFTIRMPPAW